MRFSQKLIHISAFIAANLFCHQPLPQFWWTPKQFDANFGDDLSRVIVNKLLEMRGIRHAKRARLHEKKLLAVGSVMHFARKGDTVWGSGINGKVPMRFIPMLDVRAVRGPLTREKLLSLGIDCPEVYGDPALLLPILFPEKRPTYERDYIVIPNLNEIQAYKNIPNVVLPTQNAEKVVSEILKAKFVISGSLHGIVVAEAFGIPARLIRLSKVEPMFKYRDYYYGTQRYDFKVAYSLREALQMKGESPPKCDLNLLLQSFPIEKFLRLRL